MADLTALLDDLAAESASLDAVLAPLPADRWRLPTPAPGWTIAHQIGHLTWTDEVVVVAATNADDFDAIQASAAEDPTGFVDEGAETELAEPETMLAHWRAGRDALRAALAAVPAGTRLPWFGTSMTPASMATARIMETWAHGVDVRDTLHQPIPATARLRHIAYLGVRTLGYGFQAHGRPAPTDPVRVSLEAPDGSAWEFGSPDAANRVDGPAVDFCLLITQRRHRADLAVRATGPVADEWLTVAQVFAGPPGAGREPGGPAEIAPVELSPEASP